jgi:uncharacterized protein (UPF0335 family)
MTLTLEQIRVFVPQLSAGLTDGHITEDVKTAFDKYIVPHFGKDYPNSVTGEIQLQLKKALANFTAYIFSKKNVLELTASGAQSIETETHRRSYKYDKDSFREMVLSAGYESLERALYDAILDEEFQDTPQYKKATKRLLNFTYEITMYELDFQTFQPLKSYVELIEREVLKPLLGNTVYQELKTHNYDADWIDDTDNAEKVELLEIIKEALGHYAVNLGFETNLLKLSGQRVYVQAHKDDDASLQSSAPPLDLYMVALKTRQDFSLRYFGAISQFLKDNATELGWTAPASATSTTTSTQIGIKTL